MNKNLSAGDSQFVSNEEYLKRLDEDALLADETFFRIFEIDNQLQKTKLVSALRRQARRFSVLKEFNDLLRSWQAEYADKMYDGVCNTVDFTDGPLAGLRCGKWEATDAGVKNACPHPILPIERLYNIDTETEKIKLAFFKDKRWQTVTVDRSVCADKTSIVRNLANRGVEVTSKNAGNLVEYISDVVRLNPFAVERHDAASRIGWIGKNTFAPYDKQLRYDGDTAFNGLYDAVSEKGDYDEWVEYCTRLRKDSIFLRLQMAASFASPLIEKVQTLPFVFHLWGGTGSGKTVGLMVAMSIWGNPRVGKLVRTMDMTSNNMALVASFLNSLPFAGDELQLIKRRWANYDDIVMFLCEGVDRGRNTSRSASERLKTWNNAFLFTGEEPITKSTSGGGAKNRVIEAYVSGRVVENGNDAVSFVTQNYGLAGTVFVRELRRRKDLRERYNTVFKALLQKFDTTEKQAMALACMLLADEIAVETIFITEEPLRLEDMGDFLHSRSEVDAGERAYAFIADLISCNMNRFNDTDNRGELWGRVEDGTAVINRSVLQEQLSKAGFDFSATLKSLDERHRLVRNSQGKFTHQTRVFGQKANYIKILLEPDLADNTVQEDMLPF